MNAKTPALNFQPTPRPRPLNTPDTAAALKELTRDVGFGRPTSAPLPQHLASTQAMEATEVDNLAAPDLNEPKITPRDPRKSAAAPKRPTQAKATVARSVPEGPRRSPSLRIEVDDQLWDALRIAAMKRRVTVKYIIYEALAAQGFEIDMSAIPEDGRRDR